MSVNLLAQIPFFTDLPMEELDRLVSELEVVNLKSEEILFREGDVGEHLYIVVSGELEIVMGPETGDVLVLTTLHEGEYIGEMSLIQPGGTRSASTRARGDVVLLSMSRTQFKDLLNRHPELAISMVSVLDAPHTTWITVEVRWYDGQTREMELAAATAVWFHYGKPPVPIRWVLIRDPQGAYETVCLLCTDPTVASQQIVEWFVLRWQVEVTFEEARRHLGLETQRQWSDKAIARTTPLLLGLFTWLRWLLMRFTRLDSRLLFVSQPGTPNQSQQFRMPWPWFDVSCGCPCRLFKHRELLLI